MKVPSTQCFALENACTFEQFAFATLSSTEYL